MFEKKSLLWLIVVFANLSSCAVHQKLQPWNPSKEKQKDFCEAQFSGRFPEVNKTLKIRGTLQTHFAGTKSEATIVVFDFFKNPQMKIKVNGRKIRITPPQESKMNISVFTKNWWVPFSFMLGIPSSELKPFIQANRENIPVELAFGNTQLVCDRKAEEQTAKCYWKNTENEAYLDLFSIKCRYL